MICCGTWETGEEIQITYSKEQRILYQQKDSMCIYDQFPRQVGINKGNFVEMVVKKYFEEQWRTYGDVGAKGDNNKHKSWHRVIKGVNWGHARTSETVRKMGCTGVSAARFLEMTELDG